MNGKYMAIILMLIGLGCAVWCATTGCDNNFLPISDPLEQGTISRVMRDTTLYLPTNAIISDYYVSDNFIDTDSYYRIVIDASDTNAVYASINSKPLFDASITSVDSAPMNALPWWQPRTDASHFIFLGDGGVVVSLFAESSTCSNILYIAIIPF